MAIFLVRWTMKDANYCWWRVCTAGGLIVLVVALVGMVTVATRKSEVASATVSLGLSSLEAGELVSVPGTRTSYPTTTEASVGDKTVKLALTGTAMRTKLVVNVYAIGSYVEEGAKVRTAEDLATVDCPKRLHLVMERDVDGKDMAEAFRAAIRANYPAPAFNEEVNALVEHIRGTPVRKGDHILLTHVPGVGLRFSLAGRAEFLIKEPRFTRAVWDIYLGKNNLGEHIKKGLVSRL